MLETQNLIDCLMAILRPIVENISYFLGSFVRDDMIIFGVPYYVWVCVFLFGGFLLNYFLNEV